jgi:hypothetical protein
MATGNDLRRLALALEGTSEHPHFDRAAFKVARISTSRSPRTSVPPTSSSLPTSKNSNS